MSARSCSTKARVNAAPPSRIGQRSAMPRVFNSAKFSCMMTVDFTSNPDMPMASALFSSAASMIAFIGCLMPMLTTL